MFAKWSDIRSSLYTVSSTSKTPVLPFDADDTLQHPSNDKVDSVFARIKHCLGKSRSKKILGGIAIITASLAASGLVFFVIMKCNMLPSNVSSSSSLLANS